MSLKPTSRSRRRKAERFKKHYYSMGRCAHVKEQRCIVPCCTRWPVENSHRRSRNNPETTYLDIFPACGWHHREAPDSYHALGQNEEAFEQAHGLPTGAVGLACRIVERKWRQFVAVISPPAVDGDLSY